MIGGRWAVVSLDRPNGATVERLTPFMWSAQAHHELDRLRAESATPKLLGLATCVNCSSSDAGCEVCNPDGEPPIAGAS